MGKLTLVWEYQPLSYAKVKIVQPVLLSIYTMRNLSLMKGNWGGVGTTPIQCPSWAILSLDHMGRVKQPCCIGSADSKALKPICEECGLGCYSILVAQGITGNS